MAQMPRQTLIAIEHGREKFPVLVLLHFAFGFVAAHLLVERVKQLLSGSRAGKRGAVVKRSAEAAEIEQAFRRAVERDAHAVEQIDDAGRGVAHVFNGRLVAEKVAAVNGVVEMLPGRVAFALEVFGGVDAALRAHRVRPLHRNNGEQVDVRAHLRDLDDCGQSGEAAAYHDDSGSCHLIAPAFRVLAVVGLYASDVAVGRVLLQRTRPERIQTRKTRPAQAPANSARQAPNRRFCALSPDTIPHFAQNSQMP